jgi:RNA polymerase sigma-70 factor (ECF subfamily)
MRETRDEHGFRDLASATVGAYTQGGFFGCHSHLSTGGATLVDAGRRTTMLELSRFSSLASPAEPPAPPNFDDVYEQNASFVSRAVRRLGVDEQAADDVTQQVFMIVHRRLPAFSHASAVRTWVFGILLRVVREHRRSVRRKNLHALDGARTDPETLPDERQWSPDESTARAEAARLLQRWLHELDDHKREVFILAELEGMTAQEIGDALGTNKSTVYSRLRCARLEFEKVTERYRQRDTWWTSKPA